MSRPFLWALSQLHSPVFATLHHHPHMHIPVTNTCTQYTALLTDGDSKAAEAQGLKSEDERWGTPFRTLLELQVEPTRPPEEEGGEMPATGGHASSQSGTCIPSAPLGRMIPFFFPFHSIPGGSLPTVTARHSLANLTPAFTQP